MHRFLPHNRQATSSSRMDAIFSAKSASVISWKMPPKRQNSLLISSNFAHSTLISLGKSSAMKTPYDLLPSFLIPVCFLQYKTFFFFPGRFNETENLMNSLKENSHEASRVGQIALLAVKMGIRDQKLWETIVKKGIAQADVSFELNDMISLLSALSKTRRFDKILFEKYGIILSNCLNRCSSMNLSTILSAYAKCDMRVEPLIAAFVEELRLRYSEFQGPVELAMLMSGLARLKVYDSLLFTKLAHHIRRRMNYEVFCIREISVILSAYAKVHHNDEDLLHRFSISISNSLREATLLEIAKIIHSYCVLGRAPLKLIASLLDHAKLMFSSVTVNELSLNAYTFGQILEVSSQKYSLMLDSLFTSLRKNFVSMIKQADMKHIEAFLRTYSRWSIPFDASDLLIVVNRLVDVYEVRKRDDPCNLEPNAEACFSPSKRRNIENKLKFGEESGSVSFSMQNAADSAKGAATASSSSSPNSSAFPSSTSSISPKENLFHTNRELKGGKNSSGWDIGKGEDSYSTELACSYNECAFSIINSIGSLLKRGKGASSKWLVYGADEEIQIDRIWMHGRKIYAKEIPVDDPALVANSSGKADESLAADLRWGIQQLLNQYAANALEWAEATANHADLGSVLRLFQSYLACGYFPPGTIPKIYLIIVKRHNELSAHQSSAFLDAFLKIGLPLDGDFAEGLLSKTLND